MNLPKNKWSMLLYLLAAVGAAAAGYWQLQRGKGEGTGLVSGNGRIEAVDVDVAAKAPGRVKEILVREGDFVVAGQVVARMDNATLEAQLREARAQLRQARTAVVTAKSQLRQRQSEKDAAVALLRQCEAERVNAKRHADRTTALAGRGVVSQQSADDDSARLLAAAAAKSSALARIAAAEAAAASAAGQIDGALAAASAVEATVERIEADLRDNLLTAPRDGRVQYRVAEPGEVVGAGGRVLSLVDLSDVYMTFFLPTALAGRVALGSEVRLILDAAPGYVVPAKVSFVADVAQFTPKTVETATEREKLMFRVRARIAPELLKKHITRVKTGLPGVAYLRLDPATPWPSRLGVRLP